MSGALREKIAEGYTAQSSGNNKSNEDQNVKRCTEISGQFLRIFTAARVGDDGGGVGKMSTQ